MNLLATIKGSLLEGFYPKGWDMAKIDYCCSLTAEELLTPQSYWNDNFKPVCCNSLSELDTFMGHEIALRIKQAKDDKRRISLILPAGPMGMYKWATFFLNEWKVKCDHVTCFSMDEWADAEGNTLSSDNPASFRYAIEQAFYNPLGKNTVPEAQRNFATKDNLPLYAGKLAALRKEGAETVLVFGIGRMCHIAFWEPHFAEEYKSTDEWLAETYRIGAKLHPLTIEQNAITSFKSRSTAVPCTANTIGPGIIFKADYIIGGADGVFSRGMQWQGMSFCMTLRYGPNPCVPSSFIPTLPGKLFYMKELAGPFIAEVN